MKTALIFVLFAVSAYGQITASGDLSGYLPNPTVAKIQGRAVDSTAPTSKNALLWDGPSAKWAPGFTAWADLTGKPTTFTPSTHGHAVADITAGPESYCVKVVSGVVTWAACGGTGTSQWTTAGSNISFSGGNVIIGSPADSGERLQIAGSVTSTVAFLTFGNGTSGYVMMNAGDSTHSGWTGWFKPDQTRLGYIGFDTANQLSLTLEAATKFTVNKPIESTSGGFNFPDTTNQLTAYKSTGQINFVYGGSSTTVIDATTVNNFWRAHGYQASVSEIACWTDAGTVSLTLKDSAGNAIASALSCSTSGASTPTVNGFGVISFGEGLSFTTSSVNLVKNLSISIKYTRTY